MQTDYLEVCTISTEWIIRLFDLHRQISQLYPPLTSPRLSSLNSSILRPKFQNCQQGFSLRCAHGRTTVMLLARVSPTLRCTSGQPLGLIGHFAALPDFAAIRATLQAAVHWLKCQGCRQIIGPMDGDTWHSYRFNLGPHRHAPFLMEPDNPEYYPQSWLAAGFQQIAGYYSQHIGDLAPLIMATQPAWDQAVQAGYRFRQFESNQFEREIRIIHELCSQSFQDNLWFDPISWEEFLDLYRPAANLMNQRLIWFVTDRVGKPVGFLFCIVDYLEAVRAMRGSSNWLAKVRFWWKRGRAHTVNFKSIAVLPAHRRNSLATALMHAGYRTSLELGFRRANLCLIQDDNPSGRLGCERAVLIRRYGLYEFAAEQAAYHPECETSRKTL